MQIRQQIRVLQGMCSTVDINDVHNSIKPVITKVKTGELADDEDERSLEDYRQIFIDASSAEIEMLRNQDLAKDKEIEIINANIGDGEDTQESHDQKAMEEDARNSKEKKYEELEQFYQRLASKIVIYDPLNRPILDDDDCDMSTNRDQFVMEINQMEQLNAADLDIMISPENQDILDEMFDRKEKEVKNICDDLTKEVKDQG